MSGFEMELMQENIKSEELRAMGTNIHSNGKSFKVWNKRFKKKRLCVEMESNCRGKMFFTCS